MKCQKDESETGETRSGDGGASLPMMVAINQKNKKEVKAFLICTAIKNFRY